MPARRARADRPGPRRRAETWRDASVDPLDFETSCQVPIGSPRLPLRAAPTAARVHEARTGERHPLGRELLAVTELLRHAADVGLLVRHHERDRLAAAAGTTGAAGPVH